MSGKHDKRHNPRNLPKNSWGYRVLQLRHALGWSQRKLASVSGINDLTIANLETAKSIPSLETIHKIKNMEAIYEDILHWFKQHPERMDRLRPKPKIRNQRIPGIRLLPIEVRRPKDIESLGKSVETSSTSLFFGRKSRRRMAGAGIDPKKARRNKAISLGMRKHHEERRNKLESNKESQSGQPINTGTAEAGVDSRIYSDTTGEE